MVERDNIVLPAKTPLHSCGSAAFADTLMLLIEYSLDLEVKNMRPTAITSLKTALFLLALTTAFLIFSGVIHAGDFVYSNQKSVTHKSRGGMSSPYPDVCKTPSPGGPIPIPYPNIGQSSDTSKGGKKVKVEGQKPGYKYEKYFKKSSN